MKSRFLAMFVALCFALTCVSFTAFASDSVAVYTVVNNGILPTAVKNKVFGMYRAVNSEVKSEGLGGKQIGDNYVTFTTDPSNQTYVDIILAKADFTKKYTVYSYSIYGNAGELSFIARYSGSVQPWLISIKPASLMANKWNNIQIVFDNTTLDIYPIVNGIKASGSNLKTKLANTDFASYTYIPQARLLFNVKNAAFAYDDFSCYVTDVAPTSMDYGTIKEANGFENTSHIIVGAEEPVVFSSDYNYMVCKNGADTWTAETSVSVGDVIVVEKPYVAGETEYYKTYKYITCVDPSIKNEIVNQSTMSFHQGGSALDADGNKVTDSRKDVENVFGSGLTMEFMGAGINDSSSRQSYYHTTWTKAKTYTEKYLVFEADIAFANKADSIVSATQFNLSTNGGTGLGTNVTGSKFTSRVNHYMWIYDTQKGTMIEYVNGEQYSEETLVAEKFRNGSATAIRFAVNSNYEADTADKTKLYCGYMANATLYECNTMPEIKQPLRVPGEIFNTMPITTNKISVGDIRAMFAQDDNVTICSNRSYIPITDDNATVGGGAGIIITEKDGIYNYVRISRAPSENATYALETIQAPADGSVYVGIVNYGDECTITPVLAGYDAEGNLIELDYTTKKLTTGNYVGVSFGANKEVVKVNLYVWDSLTGLRPIDKDIAIK